MYQNADITVNRKGGGIGDIMSGIAQAKGIFDANKLASQDNLAQRELRGAKIQEALANATKTQGDNTRAQRISDQRFDTGARGDDLATILSGMQNKPMQIQDARPGNVAGETLPLGQQVPNNGRVGDAMAGMYAVDPSQFKSMAEGLGSYTQNAQNYGFKSGAANAMQGGDYGLGAGLGQLAAGKVDAPFTQNAAGSVLNQFSGGVQQDNPMALAGMQHTQAQAANQQAQAGLNQRKLKGYDTDIKGMLPQIGPNGEVYYRTNTGVHEASGVTAQPGGSEPGSEAVKRDMLANNAMSSLDRFTELTGGQVGTMDALNMKTFDTQGAGATIDNAIANLLYIKSGATASPAEIESYKHQFLPSPTDTPEAQEMKLNMLREELQRAMIAPQGQQAPAPVTPPVDAGAPSTLAAPQAQDYTSQPIDPAMHVSIPPGTTYMAPDGSMRIKQ